MISGELEYGKAHSLKSDSKRFAQRMGLKLSQLFPSLKVYLSTCDAASEESCYKALKAGGFPFEKAVSCTQPIEVMKEMTDLNKLFLVAPINYFCRHFSCIDFNSMERGSMVVITFEGKWEEISKLNFKVQQVIYPSELPQDFPFQTSSGIEMRKRPSYYYRQSAALPYRLTDQGIDVMLVTTSKGKWTLPKGIVEPSLNAHISAQKEAEEEAGVLGEISHKEIGFYEIKKWGATIPVKVFSLKVSKLIPKENWLERERERKWFTQEQAKNILSLKGVSEIIEKLQFQVDH